MDEVVARPAVRGLILTPQHELLLIRMRSPEGRVFWIAPGGGVDPGETAEEALARELNEELGLTDFRLGPVVWRRRHTYRWAGRWFAQREEYRIVEAEKFAAAMQDIAEAAFVTELRWWPVEALAHTTDELAPLSLADILGRYLRDGAPAELPPEEIVVN